MTSKKKTKRTTSAPPQAARRMRTKTTKNTPSSPFPIIGIGASAGGLDALERFFSHMPRSSGFGFVVVQHLDPTHKGMLAELLQRSTDIPVVQVQDNMKVEPDHVYVIPPNHDLSILNGVLHLLEPAAPRGLRLPIDFFFRCLALDRQSHSVGVILSGMGSDGTLGLRSIKEKAGAVFVQSVVSAKFDGMPRSVIDAGLADVVASAEELPQRIIAYLKHAPHLSTPPDSETLEKDLTGLEKVIVILRAQSGHDFSLYKKSTIYRRIERRMGLHQLAKIGDYVRYLRENHHETELLFRELLIGVTSFFRDPAAWEQLKTEVIPAVLAAHPSGGLLRAWCPGCSTGEEAYSLAIIFREALEQQMPSAHFSLQIFATDLDKDAIEKARTGAYPANIAADITEARLRRFFVQEERGYRVNKDIRESVIFAPQNIVMDPPFTKLDLLTCRNLMIYFDGTLQKKLLPLFHYCLNPGGVLMLGSAETIGQSTDLFSPYSGQNRLYKRLEAPVRIDLIEFPGTRVHSRSTASQTPPLRTAVESPAMNLQALTESVLLRRHSPAAVLTTNNGDILYISGRTGKYLEPAAGKANLNIFAMAREGLSLALNEAFRKAMRQKNDVTIRAVPIGPKKHMHAVDVTIQHIAEPVSARGMMLVVFSEVPLPPSLKRAGKSAQDDLHSARITALMEELQRNHEELLTTREEMQTSQEELKSANEELQSTNEELQSTNEELTTSKEEMQSMNEELQTVNHELQSKVDDLSRASDDMKNLLNSTDIATLFLDDELRVRRFTTQTTRIIKLIPGDAGRPITDLVTDLEYPEFIEDARHVLRTLVSVERQVPATEHRWFRIRIMPYRTQDNRIDGVVITFVDVSSAKALEVITQKCVSVLRDGLSTTQNTPADLNHLYSVLKDARSILENGLTEFLPHDLPYPDRVKQSPGSK